jgi:hypothetical protein
MRKLSGNITFGLKAQMKPFFAKQLLAVIGLSAAFMVCGGAIASAQSQLELPVPQAQETPPTHLAPPPRSQNSETIPSNPMAVQPPAPQSMEVPPSVPQSPPPDAYSPPITAQPVLPAIFRGCWRGEVYNLDAVWLLPGAMNLGTWTPKTYRVCYQRTGNGPFELTFTQAGVEHDSRIFNAAGAMQLLSTSGNNALMLASLHFDENTGFGGLFGFGFGGGSSFPVNETTKLRCIVEPDGMHVWATVYGTRDGAPWFQAHWHTIFEPDSSS